MPDRTKEISEAVNRATSHFGLCVNRTWAVAGSLPGGGNNLPRLIPPTDSRPPRPPREDHSACTSEFCEHSHRDFTSVEQRHENPGCRDKPCGILEGKFPRDVLDKAVREGRPTAWKLDGETTIDPLQPYMAISHVWSDGTGTGPWRYGAVNACLYAFFVDIAQQFECEGIWWDTICIPEEKVTRKKAIATMDKNYEEARITIVHDCFLRDWDWTNHKDACFAIVMSPWFSRGWTALELRKSMRSKVAFRGSDGCLILKDIDNDIFKRIEALDLGKERPVSVAFSNLRDHEIFSVDGLLSILRSRHTSCARDVPIIAGLLAGVDTSAGDNSPQGIYQSIFKKIGLIHRQNLFHHAATMSNGNFTWCPMSIFDLPLADRGTGSLTANWINIESIHDEDIDIDDDLIDLDMEAFIRGFLRINEDGSVDGIWDVLGSDFVPSDTYIWKTSDPAARERIQFALKNKHHVLLVDRLVDQYAPVSRGLVVKVMKKKTGMTTIPCQFIGAVHFREWREQFLVFETTTLERLKKVPMKIGSAEEWEEVNTSDVSITTQLSEWCREIRGMVATSGELNRTEELVEAKISFNVTGSFYHGTALHMAARNGNLKLVRLLVGKGADVNARDSNGQTALHHAIWVGNIKITKLLAAEKKSILTIPDVLGQEPLHLAAERGQYGVVRDLLARGADPNHTCNDGQNALHRAASGGDYHAVRALLQNGSTRVIKLLDKDVRDKNGKTAFHLAVGKWNFFAVYVLLRFGASPNIRDTTLGWTPLHWAIQRGYGECVKLLLWATILKAEDLGPIRDKYPEPMLELCTRLANRETQASSTPIGVLKLVLGEYGYLSPRPSDREIQLEYHHASTNDLVCWEIFNMVRESLGDSLEAGRLRKCDFIDYGDTTGRTALHLATENGHVSLVKELLRIGQANSNATDKRSKQTPLHIAAQGGNLAIVKLLRDFGAADPYIKDVNGQTPSSLARDAGYRLVADIL